MTSKCLNSHRAPQIMGPHSRSHQKLHVDKGRSRPLLYIHPPHEPESPSVYIRPQCAPQGHKSTFAPLLMCISPVWAHGPISPPAGHAHANRESPHRGCYRPVQAVEEAHYQGSPVGPLMPLSWWRGAGPVGSGPSLSGSCLREDPSPLGPVA